MEIKQDSTFKRIADTCNPVFLYYEYKKYFSHCYSGKIGPESHY